jgi:chromosome segregation ATPase
MLWLAAGVPAAAAPVESVSARSQAVRIAPTTIDSEASLEYYIALAGALAKDDAGKRIAVLAAQLNALKAQKQSLVQQIQAAQGQRAGKSGPALQAVDARIENLKAQLARVDVAIKEIVAELDRLRAQEEREQDDIKRSQDLLQRVLDSLANAERARTEMWGAVSLNTFAKSLSPAKRREAEGKARTALTQLGEARRLRVARVTTVYEPAFRPLPQPLKVK